jgi:CRISPR/Cas system-associated protein endoribonuclease Cas2
MIDYDFIKIKNKIDLINIFNVSRYKKDFKEPEENDEHDEDFHKKLRKRNTIRKLYLKFSQKQSKQLRYVICQIFFNELNINDINKILKILENLGESYGLIDDLLQQKKLLQKEI